MTEPLVSICIPSFRNPEFIYRCLSSIEAQDYKIVEIIISDDTPDESIKHVADSFVTKLKIFYYHNSVPLKTPLNWNNALDKCKGDLYMLMHQDDWFHSPQAISKYVHAFKGTSPDFVFCQNIGINEKNEKIDFQTSNSTPNLHSDFSYLVVRNIIGPPSNVMLRKEVTERYTNGLIWLVDIDYYIRLLQQGYQYNYIKEHLVSIGIHKDQATAFCRDNPEIIVRENIYIAKRLDKKAFNKVNIYDYFWRLLRNNNIKGLHDFKKMGFQKNELPLVIHQMLQLQKIFTLPLLKIGPLSKLLMMASYFRSRLIS